MFWLLIVLLFIVSQATSQAPPGAEDPNKWLGLNFLPSGNDTNDFLMAYDSIIVDIVLRCEIQNKALNYDEMYKTCLSVVFGAPDNTVVNPLAFDIFDLIFDEINEQLQNGQQ
jgi:hypothetical protein